MFETLEKIDKCIVARANSFSRLKELGVTAADKEGDEDTHRE